MSRTLRGRFALGALGFALTLAVALPALGTESLGTIHGTLTDATTHAPLAGIRVDAYNSTGGYVSTTFTDGSGDYSLKFLALVGPFNRRIAFSDPTGLYAPAAFDGAVSVLNGTDISVDAGSDATASQTLVRGVGATVTVRRAGHPMTKLPGRLVTMTYHEDPNDTCWSRSTAANGVASLGPMPPGPLHVAVIDPTGNLTYAGETLGPFDAGQRISLLAEMTVVDPSHDVAVSVPSSGSRQKKNAAFKVKGTLNRRVTSPTTLKIVAVKGGATRTFSAKIKAGASSSSYSAKVSLPKGTWKLWAVFGGSASWAPTDSGRGKTVVVR